MPYGTYKMHEKYKLNKNLKMELKLNNYFFHR